MKNSNRGFAPLIILIIITAVAIGGGVFYSQKFKTKTSEPKTSEVVTTASTTTQTVSIEQTSRWKIYKNTKLGFQLKYPNDWKITTEDTKSFGYDLRLSIWPVNADDLAETSWVANFDLKVSPVLNKQNFEKLLGDKATMVSDKEISLSNDINARLITYKDSLSDNSRGIKEMTFEYNGKLFWIESTLLTFADQLPPLSNEMKVKYDSEFRGIINSITFTKQN